MNTIQDMEPIQKGVGLIKERISLPERFGITEEAEEQRNGLVLSASAFRVITDSQHLDDSVAITRTLATHIKLVSTKRFELTKPLLHAQKLLIALEDDHVAPLVEQQLRIERLQTEYTESEKRRVAEAERLRKVEIDRLEALRRQAEQDAQEAIKKIALEKFLADKAAAAAMLAITTAQERQAWIVNEAARVKRDEQAAIEARRALAEAEEAAAASTAAMMVPVPEAVKAKGSSQRRKMVVEVLDIHALYRARPDLVRLEPNLAGINSTCTPELPVPGLALSWETVTTTRAY